MVNNLKDGDKVLEVNATDYTTFAEWVKERRGLLDLTVKRYVYAVRKIFKIGENSLDEVISRLAKYVQEKNTVWMLYPVKWFLRFKRKEDWIDELPIPRYEHPRKRRIVYDLTKEDLLELIENIDKENFRLAAKLQWYLGLRAKEVLTLKKEDFEFIKKKKFTPVRAIIRVIGKGNREFRLSLTIPDFLEELYRYVIFKAPVGYVFYPRLNYGLSIEAAYKAYYRALKKAGQKIGIDLSTHDFRRWFINAVWRTTKDMLATQKVARHRFFQTTQRYIDLEGYDVERILKKVYRSSF